MTRHPSCRTLLLLATLLWLLGSTAATAAQTRPAPAITSFTCLPDTAKVRQLVACEIVADNSARHFEFRFSTEEDVRAGPVEVGALARSFAFPTPGVKYVTGIVCNYWPEGRVDILNDPRCNFRVAKVTIVCSWTGTWSTNWGEMRLTQSGSSVNGDYDWRQGLVTGTVTGNALNGTWTEGPSRRPPNDAGDFAFTMAEDCASFTGKWRFGSEGELSGSWDGQWIS